MEWIRKRPFDYPLKQQQLAIGTTHYIAMFQIKIKLSNQEEKMFPELAPPSDLCWPSFL